jgi:hypothetical protein
MKNEQKTDDPNNPRFTVGIEEKLDQIVKELDE